MEFSEFFRILNKGIDSYRLYDLVAEVFVAANDTVVLTSDAIGNWFKGTNHSYRKQLIDGRKYKSFDDEGFIKFLKNHTNKSWVNIRDSFKYECDKNHVINCSTPHHEVFLKSVMNQFKEIIGYPYENNTALTAHDDSFTVKDEKAFQTGTPSEQMLKKFECLISDNKIAYFMCSELTYSHEVCAFVEAVKSELLAAFVDEQENSVFKRISEFNKTLHDFNFTLDDLDPSNNLHFRIHIMFLRTSELAPFNVFYLIDEDKKRLIERRDNPTEKDVLSEEMLSKEISQLNIIEELLDMYSQIDDIYSKITSGKTLLIY